MTTRGNARTDRRSACRDECKCADPCWPGIGRDVEHCESGWTPASLIARLADITANRKVRISWEIAGNHRGGLAGMVCVGIADVPITVEVTDDRGQSTLVHLLTDAGGCAHLDPDGDLGLLPGHDTVQAFVQGGGPAAQTESDPRQVRID